LAPIFLFLQEQIKDIIITSRGGPALTYDRQRPSFSGSVDGVQSFCAGMARPLFAPYLFVDQGPVGNPASTCKGDHVHQCVAITATAHAFGRVCDSYGDP
jgi:hypothetical protein